MAKIEFVRYTPEDNKKNNPIHATDWLFFQFSPINGITLDRALVFQPLNTASRYLPSGEFITLVDAFNLAYQAHANPCEEGDELRKNGQLYISHPYEVTNILAEEAIGGAALKSAPVHDTVEDTELSLLQLAKYLGREAAHVVFPVTKIAGSENPFETEEKLFQMALKSKGGEQSVLVKLADRIHNMRTLGSLDPSSQRRIALQTWELYAPTAELFGMSHWANELFALSGPYLWPDRFTEVIEVRDSFSTEKNSSLLQTATTLTSSLSSLSGIGMLPISLPASHDILSIVSPGTGTESDIEIHAPTSVPYYLIVQNEGDFDKLNKFLTDHGLHPEMVNDSSHALNCNFAFGNQTFHVMARDLASYLTEQASLLDLQRDDLPDKEMIYGFDKNTILQIRKGIAQKRISDVVGFIQQVLNSKEEEGLESAGLMKRLREKLNLPSAETYFIGVTTPDGDRRILPSSSTVLDFAFDVWEKLGVSAVGATVNGVEASFSQEVKEGDKVSIIPVEQMPRDSKKPVKWMVQVEWLDWVRTSPARRSIQSELDNILNIKAKCDEIRADEANPNIRQKGKAKILRSVRKIGYEDFSSFVEYAKGPQSDARKRGIAAILKDQPRYMVGEKAISDLRKGWEREQNAINLSKYNTFERFLEQYGIGLVNPNEKSVFFEGYKEYIHSLPTFSADVPNQKGYLALLATVIAPFVDIQDIEIEFNTKDLGELQARIVIRGEAERDRGDEIQNLIQNLQTQFKNDLENIAVLPKKELKLHLPLHSGGSNSILIGLFEKFGMELNRYEADFKNGTCYCVFVSEPNLENCKPIKPQDIQEIIKLLQSPEKN